MDSVPITELLVPELLTRRPDGQWGYCGLVAPTQHELRILWSQPLQAGPYRLTRHEAHRHRDWIDFVDGPVRVTWGVTWRAKSALTAVSLQQVCLHESIGWTDSRGIVPFTQDPLEVLELLAEAQLTQAREALQNLLQVNLRGCQEARNVLGEIRNYQSGH